jgi:hypothetical protein
MIDRLKDLNDSIDIDDALAVPQNEAALAAAATDAERKRIAEEQERKRQADQKEVDDVARAIRRIMAAM